MWYQIFKKAWQFCDGKWRMWHFFLAPNLNLEPFFWRQQWWNFEVRWWKNCAIYLPLLDEASQSQLNVIFFNEVMKKNHFVIFCWFWNKSSRTAPPKWFDDRNKKNIWSRSNRGELRTTMVVNTAQRWRATMASASGKEINFGGQMQWGESLSNSSSQVIQCPRQTDQRPRKSQFLRCSVETNEYKVA